MISRTTMANWIIGLDGVFKPLIDLIQTHQVREGYLQADETKIKVLKETGKVATSDKWMWVVCGGPPGQPAVLFDYDASRGEEVALSLPLLEEFKCRLNTNSRRVAKDNEPWKAIYYTLNQWDTLVGYCEDGRLHIRNVLAENAIRPFAVGRRNWLFSDTPCGARASATIYSLIESAKANDIKPYDCLLHIRKHIGTADTPERLEALLPKNMKFKAAQ
jgi:hypothetical protein